MAVSRGELEKVDFSWKNAHAACVVLASGGYPVKYESGKTIRGLDEKGGVCGATVYHAGTRCEEGVYATAGGRVLGVTATGETLPAALEQAYAAAKTIDFDGVHMRSDIGARALSAKA